MYPNSEKDLVEKINKQLELGFSKSEIITNLSDIGYERSSVKKILQLKTKRSYFLNTRKTILTILTWFIVAVILIILFRTQDDKKIALLPLFFGAILGSYITERIWKQKDNT